MANTTASEQIWGNNTVPFQIPQASAAQGKFGNVLLTDASNQIAINPSNGSNGIILTASAPAASRTYTFQDVAKPGNVYISGVPGAAQNPQQGVTNTATVNATGTCGCIIMFGPVPANGSGNFTFNNLNIRANSCMTVWTPTQTQVANIPLTVSVGSIGAGTSTISFLNTDASNQTRGQPLIYYLIL